MLVVLLDHYDSFSFNVLEWLRALGLTPHCVPHDDQAAVAQLRLQPLPLVLSPGPKAPADYPATLDLVRASLGRVPVLGICLGHQMLAHVAGATVIRARAPRHGMTRTILPAAGIDTGLAPPGWLGHLAPFRAATYHSLVVDPATLPMRQPQLGDLSSGWRIDARCDEGEVQAISRLVPGEAPAFGVQFHPESFLSEGILGSGCGVDGLGQVFVRAVVDGSR